jgi:hypothetical protein
MKKIQNVLFLVFIFSPIAAALQLNYYAKTCPDLESIVQDVVREHMNASLKVAPSTLRLFFHDCFIMVSISDYQHVLFFTYQYMNMW